jgi:plastocyanin
MDEKPTRREFLGWSLGFLAALGLSPLLAAGRRFPGPPSSDGLPPRTVALRSLGGDFVFEPVGLRLEAGARLTWLNMGDFHTATAFHPVNDELLSAEIPRRIPEGAEPWHSGMLGLDAGSEFAHVFRLPGVYDYFCQPHYSFGMVGRIVVDPAGDGGEEPAGYPASELNEASREAMPPVSRILGAAGRAYEWISRINGILLLRVHGEAAAGPAGRLREELAADARLSELLERAGGSAPLRSALDRLVEAVDADAGYEELVDRADGANAPLSSAASAAVSAAGRGG